jgi:AcrR family transcriptional regulator
MAQNAALAIWQDHDVDENASTAGTSGHDEGAGANAASDFDGSGDAGPGITADTQLQPGEESRGQVNTPFAVAGIPNTLPRGPHGLDRDVVMASQRGRLLSAFVEEASEKGYNAVTIADIVRRAGTAKRTFYQHFTDKEDCYLQAFDVTSRLLITDLVRAADVADDPIDRIRVGVGAYLDSMRQMPYFAKLFLTESLAAGAAIADRWMSWVDLLADGLVGWRNESRVTHPEVPPMTKMQAVAVISGINELIRFEIRRNGVEGLADVQSELTDLAVALFTTDVG